MNDDALTTFIEQTRAAFGPLATDMVAPVRAQLTRYVVRNGIWTVGPA